MSLVPLMSGPRLRGSGDPRHRHATLRRDRADVALCYTLAPLSLTEFDRLGRRVLNDEVQWVSECALAASFKFHLMLSFTMSS